MNMKVGIPRALFYYYHYPLWKTFFADLGVQVITSLPTNRSIIDQGVQTAVDEACFPVKVYLGHIRQLMAYDLDYLFVPRIVSIEPKSYICPKFMGIPDMVRALIPDLPPLIDINVDVSRTDKILKKDILKVGRIFTRETKKIKQAYWHGLQEYYFCRTLAAQGLSMEEAIRVWEGEQMPVQNKSGLKVGVLGHGYSLYDPLISMNLINGLRQMGCEVYLPERISRRVIEQEAALLPKRVFWSLGHRMVGSALHMAGRDDIDGIIYLACFGCGPDSLIGEIIERKMNGKPFMLLTVDEHTGEAGMTTRLEAFCDMLTRRRNLSGESNLSAHG